ncbi:class I SAM-dependent methyltransferase [Lutispora thermophila]|uniref:Methyltransferase domain-containing protein n=1 Tax=Lutispora thermophila DSM 19022 TaxID=1122184 RepID=A0A1M6CJM6_9FIRM|nr:class I SAM-dependent methyltransferase [Lutispora thermophila]SHI60898.1 Methyltransferase domain-containing protein [Lutispora thermophila DSM 19022]
MNSVVNWYEKYDEDSRLTTNKARRVEFIVSTRILDGYMNPDDYILDVAAGTGIYTFYYARKGHNVLATDLTPKHIQIINNKLNDEYKGFHIKAEVNNAIDLSMFEDNQFDTVLCFGPIYHLIEVDDRKRCINECLRVLKEGGILAIAYINKHYIIPHILAEYNKNVLRDSVIKKVIDNGVIKAGEEDCFWTDAYFSSPIEMEEFLDEFNVKIIEHVATDGISTLLGRVIDDMTEDEYKTWIDYQLKTCREKSILGISNHGLIICRKI